MRWVAVFAVLSVFGISAHYRRLARRDGDVISRRREPLGLQLGRVVVALPLIGSVLVYLVRPQWMAWSMVPLPGWLRWLGVGVALTTVPAAWWLFRALGRNVSETVLTKRRHELVTTGPYRWIRHPLYTTGGALFVAVGLLSASWLILAWAVAAVGLIRVVVVPREERALLDAFGSDYEVYRARTGALLPRVGPSGRPPPRV